MCLDTTLKGQLAQVTTGSFWQAKLGKFLPRSLLLKDVTLQLKVAIVKSALGVSMLVKMTLRTLRDLPSTQSSGQVEQEAMSSSSYQEPNLTCVAQKNVATTLFRWQVSEASNLDLSLAVQNDVSNEGFCHPLYFKYSIPRNISGRGVKRCAATF